MCVYHSASAMTCLESAKVSHVPVGGLTMNAWSPSWASLEWNSLHETNLDEMAPRPRNRGNCSFS